jgi:hypothetical protein
MRKTEDWLQGILTERKRSVRLTSCYWIVYISWFNTDFCYKTSELKEEVQCTEPFPSARFPCWQSLSYSHHTQDRKGSMSLLPSFLSARQILLLHKHNSNTNSADKTHTHTHSLSLSLSHTHTHTHKHTQTHKHTHTQEITMSDMMLNAEFHGAIVTQPKSGVLHTPWVCSSLTHNLGATRGRGKRTSLFSP